MEVENLAIYGVLEYDGDNELQIIVGVIKKTKQYFRSGKVIELNIIEGWAKTKPDCVVKLGLRDDGWAWEMLLMIEPQHAPKFMPVQGHDPVAA